jgi:PIN domain nuclease of toxin-antitoxin system
MARYLIDSNVFLRSKERPHELRKEALETIEDAQNALFVSFASLWEMAIKAANGKLPYYATLAARGPGGVMDALRESQFALLDIELRHVLMATALPQHHRDPFDRMLVAQAMAENLVLITTDATLVRYAGLRTLAA